MARTPLSDEQPDGAYRPPAIVVLGTLAALTRGGTTGPSDGNGFAGDSGTL
jgi:hypothetical protein